MLEAFYVNENSSCSILWSEAEVSRDLFIICWPVIQKNVADEAVEGLEKSRIATRLLL